MVEWHLSPDYIVNNWTDELLDLMTEKLVERRQRETEAVKPMPSGSPGGHRVSDVEFFRHAGNLIRVVKK